MSDGPYRTAAEVVEDVVSEMAEPEIDDEIVPVVVAGSGATAWDLSEPTGLGIVVRAMAGLLSMLALLVATLVALR
ncbi:MAG: hypothetical protein HS104_11665 [Polyangiaceae bacterium]|nr:hypothetical protein [Polyangiaceae bacterium]MCL4748564.1 hypothetical protein [Myxococcales bacterium]